MDSWDCWHVLLFLLVGSIRLHLIAAFLALFRAVEDSNDMGPNVQECVAYITVLHATLGL